MCARFNQKTVNTTLTENRAGGEAYKQSPKLELVSLLLTSFVSDTTYESGDARIGRMVNLIDSIPDKKFVAKAGLFAREKWGMRSISHVLATLLANRVKGAHWSRKFFDRVVVRPDDMTEIFSLYNGTYGKPYPNALKRGFADAFGKFNAYQLAKYRGEGRQFSLMDIANLVHPTPTQKNMRAMKALINGTLKNTGTWESKLSTAGKSDNVKEAKAEAWRDLLKQGKLGYFAGVRNIRNIVQTKDPELVRMLCDLLIDPARIKNSKVLPFRLYVAYKELVTDVDVPIEVFRSIDKALALTTMNMPDLAGSIAVLVDISGSMDHRIGQSKVNAREIAYLMASMVGIGYPDVDMYVFSSHAEKVGPILSTSVITQVMSGFTSNVPIAGTNFRDAIDTLNKPYEHIMIFSDMQAWEGYHSPRDRVSAYKKKYKCSPHIWSFDLMGYGDMQFPEHNVYCIPGYSDKVFDVMGILVQDKMNLIKEIDAIDL